MPGHGEIALIGVLVRSSPGVMDAHRIVRCDGSVQERPRRLALILVAEFFKSVGALPVFQNGQLLSREIDLRFDLFKGHFRNLEIRYQKAYLIKDAHPTAIEGR